MENLHPLLFPLFTLWALGMLLVLFRRGPGVAYKVSALLIFVFYAVWFQEPILASFELYRTSLDLALPAFFGNLQSLFALGLLVLWPGMVFVVFQTGAGEQAAGLLRTMVLLTLLFWLFWMLNYFLAPWPGEMLRELVPRDFKMPDLPSPPVQAQ